MQENNTTNQDSSTLATATDTVQGTTEHGALKTIHKSYNKLSGYEAMLHIISRFRFVLYPFIFLSVMGSTYSFYNDFIKAFPMIGDYANIAFAFFFSLMLEIVRDGSLIALFNSKMKLPSRLLVIVIFLSVTTYLYSSHLKAIEVIEKASIEYALSHQTEEQGAITNPRYQVAIENLSRAKKRLEQTEAERVTQLDISANAKYRVNKINAQKQLPILDTKIEKLEREITRYQEEIISYKNSNIEDVENTQKLISGILLATLILIETLAMLGAVIKFINKNNADKEIAKHKEIVEEYVAISEQMKIDNEELTKNLSVTVKAQSESNQNVMQMMSEDMKRTSSQNVKFLEMMAENKQQTMQQLNTVLEFVAKGTQLNPHAMQQQSPLSFNQEIAQEPEHKPMKKIGFAVNSRDDLINKIFKDVDNRGDKLPSKSSLISIKDRTQKKIYETTMRELKDFGIVDYQRGKGYYLAVGKESAMHILHEDEQPFKEV